MLNLEVKRFYFDKNFIIFLLKKYLIDYNNFISLINKNL